MDKEYVRQLLPEEPPAGLVRWTMGHCGEELGPDYLVYHSEYVPVYPTLGEIMEYNSLRPGKKVRAAVCTCHVCGAEFVTENLPGNLGIRLFIGEDGQTFSVAPGGEVYAGEDADSMGYYVELGEGDVVYCPLCFFEVKVIHKKRIAGGRTKQIRVISVERVGDYCAVVYWLVWRRIYEYGAEVGCSPRDAYVIAENGSLVRYTHATAGGICYETQSPHWRLCSGASDSLDKCYFDWGSINNRKMAAYFFPEVPDLTGTTGEKTGLAAYCKRNPVTQVAYLKLWRRWRPLENLAVSGWTELIEDIVARNISKTKTAELAEAVDMSKKKPHEALCMSRADFKFIRKQGLFWGADTQQVYRMISSTLGTSAMEFWARTQQFGESGVRSVAEMARIYGDVTFDKVERYLNKQYLRPDEVGLLLESRNMARALAGNQPLTSEELWPRNLHHTHDRLARIRAGTVDAKTAAKYQLGFDLIREKYGALEWSDGDLTIILPRNNGELVREGSILRHCVGVYGEDHIAQRDVIFFVRRYRRPDRCYYTLDMQLNGDKPVRRQLHGYGNERHGAHKQYSHKIPRKVLDFCDRWEQEVLKPFWADYQKRLKKEMEARKRA